MDQILQIITLFILLEIVNTIKKYPSSAKGNGYFFS